MTTEQRRDPLQSFEVIDGPRAGERFACERDNFDVLTGDPMRGTDARYTYRLTRAGDGYVWRCGIEAAACRPD